MASPTSVQFPKFPASRSFPVYSFRHLKIASEEEGAENPIKSGPQCYVLIANVRDLPPDIPVERTNPRDQKLSGRVPNRIRESLMSDNNFVHLNRGLLISAGGVSFDNRRRGKAAGTCTIDFTDPDCHGLVDGGHSYKIILKSRDELEFDQFVKLEILTGVEEFFTNLAEARNTSNQVQDKSLDELRDKFEALKEAIKGTKYADLIAYRENDDKPIDIRDLISYLTCFNVEAYGEDEHPVSAFTSKKKCLDDFRRNPKGIEALLPLADQIFKLRDYIHWKSPEIHNQSGGKYGKLREVERQKTRLNFLGEESDQAIPYAYIYPILAAMRVLIGKGPDGKLMWKKDPFKFFDDVGPRLVESMVEKIRQVRNPNAVGKDRNLWALLYLTAAMRLNR